MLRTVVSALAALGLLCAGCSGDSGGSSGSSGGSGGAASASGGNGGSGSGGGTGGTTGSSTGGTASFTGELAFPATGALASMTTYPDGGITNIDVVSLDVADSCARTGNPPSPFHGFKLEVGNSAAVPTLGTGTFTDGATDAPSISGRVFSSEPGGEHVGSNYLFILEAGTVTLTAVDSAHVAGSVDLQLHLPDGGLTPFAGTFDAPFCP